MRLARWRTIAVALVLAGLAAGCGGRGEKGKNQDFDRPKASEKK
jgi:hypothetical protein